MAFLLNQNEYLRQQNLFPAPLTIAEKQIMRQGIRFYAEHTFKIPYTVSYSHFSYYKLLYWSGHHLLESIEAGMIVRDDRAFVVRYCKGINRGKILANPSAQYAVSFRAPSSEWGIDPIALISETN